MQKAAAQLPTEEQLDTIAEVMRLALDEAICWRMVNIGLVPGKLSRSYCWERDTNRPLRHQNHYLKITQLQLQFFFEARVVKLEFLSIPEVERRKGIGKKIVESVFQIGRELGYQQMVLHSVKYSMPFWLSLGFQPVAPINPLNPKTPRRMVCKL
jgi:GNAT superfamily N-acetyltransferase